LLGPSNSPARCLTRARVCEIEIPVAGGRRPCRMLLGCARGRTGIYGRRTCELVQDLALPVTWQDLRWDQTVGGITRLPHLSKLLRYSLHGILQRENYIECESKKFCKNFSFFFLLGVKDFYCELYIVVFSNQCYNREEREKITK